MRVIMDRDRRRGHSHRASSAPDVLDPDTRFTSIVLDSNGDDDAVIWPAAQTWPTMAAPVENDTGKARIFLGPNDEPRDRLDIRS